MDKVPENLFDMFVYFYPTIDILQGRDNKGNNLAHILSKDYNTKVTITKML